jgi:hypothetical protein
MTVRVNPWALAQLWASLLQLVEGRKYSVQGEPRPDLRRMPLASPSGIEALAFFLAERRAGDFVILELSNKLSLLVGRTILLVCVSNLI